jgi:ribonucleoside-diphosphate reductase alpha chain
MFVDDSACNLASLNLMKFQAATGGFDVEKFKHVTTVVITAMEIEVGFSSYPTPAITQNSYDYRPLGIGYANLGALLMSYGLPYDSDEGRNCAAAITALLSGHAYFISSLVAKKIGAFAKYAENKHSFSHVIGMHREHSYKMNPQGVPSGLLDAAQTAWDNAYESGEEYGFRNAQISVLAPTGTIAFLMDCDTTGIEPDIALVKYKWLVGGGMIKIVNQTVPLALRQLGYNEAEEKAILEYLDRNDTIEGAPDLRDEHLPVFDCAFKPAKGKRSIQYMGHVHMMSAVQPFISGAISKTVNMPSDVSTEEIYSAYIEAWKEGLKAIAIYRDGSKRTQALTTSRDDEATRQQKKEAPAERIVYKPMRRRLADERKSVTHKFQVGNHEGYVTVGLYEDGQPGEVFITMAKEGSTISGMMDSFATAASMALQYGVPLKVLVSKFTNTRFEPNGMTSNPNIRFAKSIVDYVFKWMGMKFLLQQDQEELGLIGPTAVSGNGNNHDFVPVAPVVAVEPLAPHKEAEQFASDVVSSEAANYKVAFDLQGDAPLCSYCGSITVRAGSCYKCMNCGSTTGCG